MYTTVLNYFEKDKPKIAVGALESDIRFLNVSGINKPKIAVGALESGIRFLNFSGIKNFGAQQCIVLSDCSITVQCAD